MFTLGAGMVIRGWDQGLKDMCIGEKRVLDIPSELAYGVEGAGAAIGPYSITASRENLCGNGVIDQGEECDDGARENGDGCNALCRLE